MTTTQLLVLSALLQESPFNGKDLTGWRVKGKAERSQWKVGKASLDPANQKKMSIVDAGGGGGGAELVNLAGSADLYTDGKYGDVHLEIEVMVPRGSNSGIYLMGEYEVQVLDSFGRERIGKGDMGAVYGVAAPRVNACKAPGEWQKFVIDFQAPRFDDAGKKIKNALFVKIELNGQTLLENVEVQGPTGGSLAGKEAATGPLLFQGDHGPVAFRNIKISPLK